MCGGAVSLGLPFCGRCGSVVLAAYRAVGSHRFGVLWSRRYRSLGAVLLACPPSSGLPGIVLASSRRHAVGGWGIGSSSLALLVRYGERGAWSGRCLLRWAGHFRVRSMWYHHASFLIGWRRAACFVVVFPYRPIVLVQCRIAWRGRLLGKTAGEGRVACLLRGDVVVISPLPLLAPFPIVRISRAVLVCIRFRPGNRSRLAPPLVSNKTGSKTGRDFAPVLDLPHPIRSCCLFQFQFLALPPPVGSSLLAGFN